MNEVVLNPDNHAYAVRRFTDHFGIRPAAADGELLDKILRAFAEIPYENISKIIKLNRYFLTLDRLRLPEEVIEDFLCHHLGGTCFSLSFFLHCILQHSGFQTHIVMADMHRRPNVHCALIAFLQEALYLIDPGYLLTQPMRIHPDRTRVYRTPHSGMEIRFDGDSGRYQLYTFDRQTIKYRYAFFTDPTPLAEFAHHWLASFYQSGMHGLCLTRRVQDQLVYLHNDYLQIAGQDGKNTRHVKTNYQQVVAKLFDIAPEWVERAQEALADNKALERVHGFYQPKGRTDYEAR